MVEQMLPKIYEHRKKYLSQKVNLKNIYIYIYLAFPGKTIVEYAQLKFTVLKARSWRAVKAKVHNPIVNEKKKKKEYIENYDCDG